MKNKNTCDYTRMQVKAFLQLCAVAAYVALAFGVVFVLRDCGVGENPLLYFGTMLVLFLLLLVLMVVFLQSYVKMFQEIDGQLEALLSGGSQGQLPQGLACTEQKIRELNEAMQKRIFREQLAEQQKNDLVMYLAHDIRTPLTSIIGYLSLLDEAQDMPKAQREKYTHITLEKAYKLEKMINEFFEIARYSLQEIQLNKEEVDLCYMLVQLTDELLPVLAQNGNTTEIQMEREDLFVYADREKLARVFSNLLKNAAAYSYPHTKIVISAKECGETVEIAFCNHGKTIPPDELAKLCDKFYRIDQARASGVGGAGLGLAIAKEIVELHGGTLCADSKNETVTILVTIPAAKSHS